MTIPLFQVDAFTDKPFAGNPAAVCILPVWKEDSWLQAVAAEIVVGFSTQSWAYDPAGNQTLAIDADGNTTSSVYDNNILIKQFVYQNGDGTPVSSETFGYDPAGNQTSTIDADGNTTVSAYDGMGNMTLQSVYDATTSHSLFASQSWAYDANGNLTEQIDIDGGTTMSYYDGLGYMTEQTVHEVGGGTVTQNWAFDPAGNVTQHLSYEGFTTDSTYDNSQLVAQQVYAGDTEVDSETWGYDANGNVTSHLDNDGDVTSSTYEGLGLMSAQTIKYGDTVLSSETWLYDGDGNVTDQIDLLGSQTRETRYVYNDLGQKTQEIDGYGSAAALTLAFSYDDDGNLLGEIDGDGNTTVFEYNAMGEATLSEDVAATMTIAYQYDADGNKISEVDADGRLQTFAYNAFGQETSNVWYAGATTGTTETESISFGYDANDNMTFAANSAGTYTMEYDPLGRLTLVDEPYGVSLNFGYDAAGNRTLVSDNFGGTESSVYNPDNLLMSREYTGEDQDLLTTFSYDYLGEMTQEVMMYGGTTVVSTNDTGYDANGNVTNMHDVTAGGTTTVNFDYAYDVADELTQQIDNSCATTNFAYDTTGQLVSAGSADYAYDANGNPNNTGETTGVDNELTTYIDPTTGDTVGLSYDHAGNVTASVDTTSGANWAYGYDNQNHLISAVETVDDEVEVSEVNTYDAFGNLIKTVVVTPSEEMDEHIEGDEVSGSTTYSSSYTTSVTKYAIDQWNPDNGSGVAQVWADLNVCNGLQTRYVGTDNVNQLLARVDVSSGTGTAYWYLLDRQNSTRDIITNTAVLKDTLDYNAFGNIIWEYDSTYGGDVKYTGEQFDAVTGLQYNVGRWYNPVIGRWMSQDPLGFDAGDSNLYRYVNNAPAKSTDPSGFFEEQPAEPGKGTLPANPEKTAGTTKTTVNPFPISMGDVKTKLTFRSGVNYETTLLDENTGKKVAFLNKDGVAIKLSNMDEEKAKDVHIMQLAWLEIAVTDKMGNTHLAPDTVRLTSGTQQLTVNSSRPIWHLDTHAPFGGNILNAFYDQTFTSFRTADSLTIYDTPGFPARPAMENVARAMGGMILVTKVQVWWQFADFVCLDFAGQIKFLDPPTYWTYFLANKPGNLVEPQAAKIGVYATNAEIKQGVEDHRMSLITDAEAKMILENWTMKKR